MTLSFAESDTTTRQRRGFVEVDVRHRCSLAKVQLEQRFTRYRVDELPDGTLILTPAMIVPVSEWVRAQARPRGPEGMPA